MAMAAARILARIRNPQVSTLIAREGVHRCVSEPGWIPRTL